MDGKEEQMTSDEAVYFAAKRKAEFEREGRELPERELLREARAGDSRAAIELLMWPKWHPLGKVMDQEVYEAIVAGALDVAFFVANEVKVKGSEQQGAVVGVKPLMFFNGGNPKARAKSGRKDKNEIERIIGSIVANGDAPFDKNRLTQDDLREALTTDFQRPGLKLKVRPKLYREVEARLMEYVRWKYSRDVSSEADFGGRELVDIDEELCSGLVSISFQQYEWHRNRDKEFPYPPDWD